MNAPETTFKWISILDKPEYLLSDLQLQNSFGLSYVKGKIHVLDFHQWQGLCDLSQPLHCSGDTLVGQPSDKVEYSRSRHFQGLSPSERYSICLSRVTLSWRSDHRLFNIYCIKKNQTICYSGYMFLVLYLGMKKGGKTATLSSKSSNFIFRGGVQIMRGLARFGL